jgi:hypothetical protein
MNLPAFAAMADRAGRQTAFRQPERPTSRPFPHRTTVPSILESSQRLCRLNSGHFLTGCAAFSRIEPLVTKVSLHPLPGRPVDKFGRQSRLKARFRLIEADLHYGYDSRPIWLHDPSVSSMTKVVRISAAMLFGSWPFINMRTRFGGPGRFATEPGQFHRN